MESWVVESAGSVLWGQIPGAAAVQGGKLQTQEKQQLVFIFLAFHIFPGDLLNQMSAGGVVWMKWRPC